VAAIAEFTITIDEGPEISAAYTRPDGGEEEVERQPLTISRLERRTLEFLISLLRGGRLNEDWEYEVLGSNLFAILFCAENRERLNDIGHKLMEAMAETRAQRADKDSLLRITLKLQEKKPDLASWPWEYLYKPELAADRTSYFIAHRTRLALTRYLALPNVRSAERAAPPLKVLLVAPSSQELPVEPTSVLEELEKLDADDKIDLMVLPATDDAAQDRGPRRRVTFKDFEDVVSNFDPHVIHFLGHGRHRHVGDRAKGEIAFTDDTGESASWCSDQRFANLLDDWALSLHLVFLQACESADATTTSSFQTIAGMAQSISNMSVPAVVAMHYRLAGGVGNALSREFYASLAADRSVLLALNHARQIADLETQGVFGLPVLYLRGSGDILGGEGPGTAKRTGGAERIGRAPTTVRCPWDEVMVELTQEQRCPKCGRVLICPACRHPRTWLSDKCSNCEQRIYADAGRGTGYDDTGRVPQAADRIGEPEPPRPRADPHSNGDVHS
jgi:hypothetical protein